MLNLAPMPAPCYQPVPAMVQHPVSTNDCCCQCGGSQCKYRGRARTHGSRIFSALSQVEEDPTCNSEKLRAVIEEVNESLIPFNLVYLSEHHI